MKPHLTFSGCEQAVVALPSLRTVLARCKELYEAQHPETKHGSQGGGRDGKGTRRMTENADSATSVASSFVKDTAEKTGRGKRTVEEDVAIGTKLTPAAAEIIRGTPVDVRVLG